MTEPRFVPTDDEQAWLLARLRELIDRHGYEHFAIGPWVLSDEHWFPDPWTPSPHAFTAVVERCLVYADLEAEAVVQVYPDHETGSLVPAGPGAAAWLIRHDQGRLHIGVRVSTLRDRTTAIFAAARVVAEGFRAIKEPSTRNSIVEQRLIDVTAVFLSFGWLTLAARVRHGRGTTTTQLGVLPAQAIAFLLAAQLRLRAPARSDERQRFRHLPPNPASFVQQATLALPTREVLLTQLGVPPPSSWPTPPSLEDLLASHKPNLDPPSSDHDPSSTSHEDRGVLGKNRGQVVFRVERSSAYRLARLFGLPVVLLAMLSGRMQLPVEIPIAPAALLALVLAGVGLIVGRFIPDRRCSEPQCMTPLTPEMETCPRCKGTIAGVIHHPKERLAAEEAIHRQPSQLTSAAPLEPSLIPDRSRRST